MEPSFYKLFSPHLHYKWISPSPLDPSFCPTSTLLPHPPYPIPRRPTSFSSLFPHPHLLSLISSHLSGPKACPCNNPSCLAHDLPSFPWNKDLANLSSVNKALREEIWERGRLKEIDLFSIDDWETLEVVLGEKGRRYVKKLRILPYDLNLKCCRLGVIQYSQLDLTPPTSPSTSTSASTFDSELTSPISPASHLVSNSARISHIFDAASEMAGLDVNPWGEVGIAATLYGLGILKDWIPKLDGLEVLMDFAGSIPHYGVKKKKKAVEGPLQEGSTLPLEILSPEPPIPPTFEEFQPLVLPPIKSLTVALPSLLFHNGFDFKPTEIDSGSKINTGHTLTSLKIFQFEVGCQTWDKSHCDSKMIAQSLSPFSPPTPTPLISPSASPASLDDSSSSDVPINPGPVPTLPSHKLYTDLQTLTLCLSLPFQSSPGKHCPKPPMFDSMKGFKAIVEGGGGGGPGGWEDGRGGGLEHLIFKMGIPFVWYREYAFLLPYFEEWLHDTHFISLKTLQFDITRPCPDDHYDSLAHFSHHYPLPPFKQTGSQGGWKYNSLLPSESKLVEFSSKAFEKFPLLEMINFNLPCPEDGPGTDPILFFEAEIDRKAIGVDGKPYIGVKTKRNTRAKKRLERAISEQMEALWGMPDCPIA